MAATKRQKDWASVVWTPSTGLPVTITGVTNVSIALNGGLVKFSGDGDNFMTTVVADVSDPTITVTAADIIALNAISVGVRTGSFACTHKDAKAALGGAITYTMSNARWMDVNSGGAHRQIGSGTVVVCGESSDGSTSPLAISLA